MRFKKIRMGLKRVMELFREPEKQSEVKRPENLEPNIAEDIGKRINSLSRRILYWSVGEGSRQAARANIEVQRACEQLEYLAKALKAQDIVRDHWLTTAKEAEKVYWDSWQNKSLN